MKMKNVLLVNDNSKECEVINTLLTDLFPNVSVRVAENGRCALDCLMGVENEESRLNPDVIIISDSITDFTPTEICNVVSNYYRFRHIKFYLLADPAKIQPAASDRALFSGYLNRPLSTDSDTRAKFSLLKPDLESNIKQLAFFPLLVSIKSKLIPFSGSISGGVKAAACIACIGTAAVVVPARGEGQTEKEIAVAPMVRTITSSVVLQPELPLPVVVVPEEAKPVVARPVKKEEAVSEVTPVPEEPQPAKDTVVVKKTFSIGVKKIDRSKP